MIGPYDTRIRTAMPAYLTPLTDHERTVARCRKDAHRAAWRRLFARLLRLAPQGGPVKTPISPPS